MEIQRIEDMLGNATLEHNWKESLATWNAAPEQQVTGVLAWVSGLRDHFLQVVREVEDPDEIDYTLAIRYIELKSHWIMLNTLMAYQNFRFGEADIETAHRASVLSYLLEATEPLLNQADISQITAFLVEPISRDT